MGRVRPATDTIIDALGLALKRKGETQPVREAAAAALREIGSAVGPEHEQVSEYASSPVGTETRPLEESRPSKFGTSGDRGIIGKDFDFPLIHKLAQGTALYAKENYNPGQVTLIGRDTRRMNAEFQRETAAIHAGNGMPVIVVEDEPVPTPVLAFYAGSHDEIGGVINLTASHSPYTDGGFKFSPDHGGAADEHVTGRIQELSNSARDYRSLDYEEAKRQGLIKVITAQEAVDQYVHGYLMPIIRESGALGDIVNYIQSHPDFELVLDPMQGTGVRVMHALYAAIAKEAGRDFFTVINENNNDPEFKDVHGAPQPDKPASNGRLVQKVKKKNKDVLVYRLTVMPIDLGPLILTVIFLGRMILSPSWPSF